MSGGGDRDADELRKELTEVRETLRAMISGEVDAVIPGDSGPVMLRAAQQALRESEGMFRAVFEGSRDAMVIADDEGCYVDCNPAATELYGVPREQLLGTRVHEYAAEDGVDEHWEEFLETADEVRGYFALQRPDGEIRLCEYSAARHILPGRHLSILRDVTDEKRLQRQVQVAQKMEAVGRLAGGIAHDFNNLLTTITMVAGYVGEQFRDIPGLREEIDVIEDSARRAGVLTRQLLAVGRRQAGRPERLDLNRTLVSMRDLFARTLGERIEVRYDLDGGPTTVLTDRSQIEQVLLNLVVNARDAMPAGGVVTLSTEADLSPRSVPSPPEVAPASRWVALHVADTGIGMDARTRQRLFEPFFTTKSAEGGTGLGLSMAYGIVAHSDGFMTVHSAPGEGATLSVYLPLWSGDAESERAVAHDTARPEPGGAETILLVEDEDAVRASLSRALTRRGYEVLAFGSGVEALQAIADCPRAIDLVLTDVVMPEVSGPELVRRIRELGGGPRVLYVSGYAAGAFEGGVADAPVLAKPFHPRDLLEQVRTLLEG